MRWLVPVAMMGLLSCNGSSPGNDDAKPPKDGPHFDGVVCGKRPPDITLCHKPPNLYSDDLYFCECTGYCGGGPPSAACNAFNGDCRYFYDTCVPMTYTRCAPGASDAVLGLCGYCFFREAGGIPADCDKLTPRDSGADSAATDLPVSQ